MIKTLIVCIDRDNDLYNKAGVSGPVVGRKANFNAATKLALADPEDVDANAMFYAVKLYDSMSKSKQKVEVVTLTGHKSLGYKADREISNQLDRLVRELGTPSCILVSDGASDEEIIPIIKSRMKIVSTKIVYVKQAKELERTYYVILEKLRDPYYAKMILGIPALLLLLFSISSYSGLGWQPAGIVIGLYLLLFKGFGWEDSISEFFNDLNFSFERVSWMANVSAIIIFALALIVGNNAITTASNLGLSGAKFYAYVSNSVISLFLLSALFVILGKAIDAILDKRPFIITRYSLYAIALVLLTMIIGAGLDWITNINPPYVSFADFFVLMLSSLFIAWISLIVVHFIRTNSLLSMKLEGKEVINNNGTLIGRIVGIDGTKGNIILENVFAKKITLPFDSIFSVADKVIVRSLV